MALRGACGLRFPHPTPALLSENQHIIGRKLSPQLEAGAPTLLCPTPHLGLVLKLGDHPPQTGEQSTWPGAGQLDGVPCEADMGSPGSGPSLSPDLVPKASSEPPAPRDPSDTRPPPGAWGWWRHFVPCPPSTQSWAVSPASIPGLLGCS